MTMTARGLDFSYTSGQPIFQALDAVFEAGEMSALVGRSGSGKSTLLYILGLMLTPTGGVIEIDGVDVQGLPDWARADIRAQKMGFVFQDALLDPARTVLDNVLESALYGGIDCTEDDALALLDEFEVTVDPRRRPGQISGGQAQRVALCRAFLTNPPIVLADEPTGNLDATSADIVWSALRSRAERGSTVIVATHDLGRAETCDKTIVVRSVSAA